MRLKHLAAVAAICVSTVAIERALAQEKPQNQTPKPEDVQAMMAALPDKVAVKPRQPRKVLVIARAVGYVHSSIPLAARTVEEMGKKTAAWSTTITYDVAGISEQSLKEYDAIVLVSTTGEFLDDPNDAAVTAARRKAVLDFVRGGKGLAGIHAASDTYHRTDAPGGQAADKLGPDSEVGTWPEWNKMIGGYFKWHWNDGQLINVKVDDPNHPINAPFKGKPQLQIVDETYTYGRNSFSRQNCPCPDQRRLRQDECRGQSQGAIPARRSRLRAQLDPPGGERARVLRSSRPQRKGVCDHALARARDAGGSVRAR